MSHIIIIDDDRDSRDLLRSLLKLANIESEIFSSAESFLASERKDADLYLIDINLGGKSGLEVCEYLKQNPKSKSIPVVIISAHPEIEKLSRNASADAFLQKPFSKSILLEKIGQLIS